LDPSKCCIRGRCPPLVTPLCNGGFRGAVFKAKTEMDDTKDDGKIDDFVFGDVLDQINIDV